MFITVYEILNLIFSGCHGITPCHPPTQNIVLRPLHSCTLVFVYLPVRRLLCCRLENSRLLPFWEVYWGKYYRVMPSSYKAWRTMSHWILISEEAKRHGISVVKLINSFILALLLLTENMNFLKRILFRCNDVSLFSYSNLIRNIKAQHNIFIKTIMRGK